MFEKIEIFDRKNNSNIIKFVLFKSISTHKFYFFYEYSFNFPNSNKSYPSLPSLPDGENPENPSDDYQQKLQEFMNTYYVHDPEYQGQIHISTAEVKEIIYQERLFFFNLILERPPDVQHQLIFDGEYPDGFDTINELLDAYLRKFHNKTLKERFEEQFKERKKRGHQLGEWSH